MMCHDSEMEKITGRIALRAFLIGAFTRLTKAAALLSGIVLLAGVLAGPVAARQHYLPEGAYTDVYALQYAARPGNSAEFSRLITQYPALVSLTTTDGTTMLQWALATGNREAFRLLLRAGAKADQPGFDDDTVIHDAARHRSSKWLKLLLEQGASPNVRNAQSGAVPLSRALIADRDKQFEMLLKAGADPNIPDATGNTPLHVAAQINKPWHVYALLTNRTDPADPFILNAQGQTFQRYLFMTPDQSLTRQTRKARQVVLDYLSIKDIPIEPGAPPHQKKGFKQ
jgi:uncharacterized protein